MGLWTSRKCQLGDWRHWPIRKRISCYKRRRRLWMLRRQRQRHDEPVVCQQVMIGFCSRLAGIRVPIDAENLFVGFDDKVITDMLPRTMDSNRRCFEIDRMRKRCTSQQRSNG